MKLKNRLIFTSHVKSIKTLSEFIGYVAESTLGTIVIVVIGVIFSPLLLVLFPFAYIERCIREALYVKRMLEKNPQLRGYYEGNKEEVEWEKGELIMELKVKGSYDKKNERWYVETDETTVEEMNSFLEEHDFDVFEAWLGYLEDGMSSEALAFVDLLQTTKDEIELADGSKIKLVEHE